MKYKISIFILFTLFALSLLAFVEIAVSPMILNKFYYNDMSVLSSDLSRKNNFKYRTFAVFSNMFVTQNNDTFVINLTDDVVINKQASLKNVELNLNGHSITFVENGSLLLKGKTSIANGCIIDKKSTSTSLISTGRISNCTIENVNIASEHEDDLKIVDVHGQFLMIKSDINCSINNGDVTGIYGNLFSNINIESSNIIVSSQYGIATGVELLNNAVIKDCNIFANAPYDSDENKFLSLSIGINSSTNLTIENSHVIGVHSGINSYGDLNINGGIYEGYGHGGIYVSGYKTTAYIKNAIINECKMPDGFEPIRTNSTCCGMYVGGGAGCDNIKVYIDCCMITGTKHSIAMRGSSGEKNNSLYISQSEIINSIRVDNNTHKIYAGINCKFINFSNENVFKTNEIYVRSQ